MVLSANGWVRAARGHNIDPTQLAYKAGDECLSAARGKTSQPAIFLDTAGRTYALPSNTLPSARSQGEPLTGRLALANGERFIAVVLGESLLPIEHVENVRRRLWLGEALIMSGNSSEGAPIVDDARDQLASIHRSWRDALIEQPVPSLDALLAEPGA